MRRSRESRDLLYNFAFLALNEAAVVTLEQE